jgi:CTP:molybdopterin cytidylyltransferase MocA
VLAAGRGSRLGGAKHLLPLDGVPLAERVVRALTATSAARVTLVLAPDDAAGRALAAKLGVRAVPAENADEGRAARFARRCAPAPDERGDLVALADQRSSSRPTSSACSPRTARRRAARSCAPATRRAGTPVLFARALRRAPRAARQGRRPEGANPHAVHVLRADVGRSRAQ